MADEPLRELLSRVHERLSSSSTIDPESREMLATVMRDIDTAMVKGRAGAVSSVPASGTVPVGSVTGGAGSASAPPAHRVEALAVRFESDHPAMAQLLRQLGALLGQAGI